MYPNNIRGYGALSDEPQCGGTFTLHVDSQPMAAGDVLELRIYQMC
jgi:hypothetical protein